MVKAGEVQQQGGDDEAEKENSSNVRSAPWAGATAAKKAKKPRAKKGTTLVMGMGGKPIAPNRPPEVMIPPKVDLMTKKENLGSYQKNVAAAVKLAENQKQCDDYKTHVNSLQRMPMWVYMSFWRNARHSMRSTGWQRGSTWRRLGRS